ncbi:MAG: acyl-ACP--UDP-N-acetylglucosamine O-acyltransferase [Fimbriiglobus sp.]
MPRLIHPTAVISSEARLADDVTVGPYAVIDGPVTLGPGCTVAPTAHLIGPLNAGRDNHFGTGCVIGGAPQHLGYKGEPTRVEIGDGNTFREHVTVHRAMPATGATRIGNHNLLMVNSHVAHDCRVGDHCLFANGAVIGGHVEVGDRALLSGNSAVHQSCRIGRLALLSGTSSVTQDMPPFWIAQGGVNHVCGVNVIGMRRAGLPAAEISAARHAFRVMHLRGLAVTAAATQLEQSHGEFVVVRELIEFVRTTKRGICSGVDRALARTVEADHDRGAARRAA